MSSTKILLVLSVIFTFSQPVFAQDNSGGAPKGFEAGIFVGNILPNQIPGMEEIHPQGGIRMGWSQKHGGADLAIATGKGEGVEWGDVSLSFRMDIPVDTYIAMAYLGVDYIRYQGVGEDVKSFGGGHVGGGLMIPVGGPAAFRLDMKFNVNPGTSLLIAFGFVLTFGGDSQGP